MTELTITCDPYIVDQTAVLTIGTTTFRLTHDELDQLIDEVEYAQNHLGMDPKLRDEMDAADNHYHFHSEAS